MNHPKREEWVPYLYGEATPDGSRKLKDHLEHCPQCRQEIGDWERSLNRLNAWKLPAAAGSPRQSILPLLKLAAAAAVVLAAGFGAGRLSSASGDLEQVRKAIEPQIRQELRAEFSQMLREEMDKADSQRLADYVALKKDLDTVAVLTDAELRRAQRQLGQLANYTAPVGSSDSRQ